MRRFLLAGLAFLLLFLPIQAGGASASSTMPCCPCSGSPACPPRCPAPSPSIACAVGTMAMAIPSEVEAAVQRHEEVSPAPAFVIAQASAADRPRARFDTRDSADPPDRSDGQALLKVFRI